MSIQFQGAFPTGKKYNRAGHARAAGPKPVYTAPTIADALKLHAARPDIKASKGNHRKLKKK